MFESKTCKVEESEFKIDGGEIKSFVKIYSVDKGQFKYSGSECKLIMKSHVLVIDKGEFAANMACVRKANNCAVLSNYANFAVDRVSSFRKLVDMIIFDIIILDMIMYQCILCKYANATILSFPSYCQTCVCIHKVDF